MVRKSKRKQTIVAFEKTLLPIPIHLSRYESIAVRVAGGAESMQVVLKLLNELSVCETQNKQIKLLQEAKPTLKNILSQPPVSANHEVNIKTCKLLVQMLCDPSHIWFRKYLEWLFEALMKSSLFSSSEIRQCVRDVCLNLLSRCQHEENLLDCTIDRCFEWINTFQWMNQFDKEISWIDDAEWVAEQGCWNSSVWPAGQDLGDGTLLMLLNVMEPLLRRCATVLDLQQEQQLEEEPGEETEEVTQEKSRSATELMRFAECAGECMRVLSAILKPRRGGVISPANHDSCTNPENDRWDVVSSSVLSHGCRILSSDLVSKDVLTSTALAVMNIQWLLRVRLWEQAELTYRQRQRTVSEARGVGDVDLADSASRSEKENTDSGLSTGLQLIALLGLLRLDPKTNSKSSEKHSASFIKQLFCPYAHLVGISPVLVTSLVSTGERVEPTIPYLSRCALLRACLSVFDLSALMFQPCLKTSGVLSEDLKSALAYVVTSSTQLQGNQIRYSPTNMITPSEVEKVASYIVSDMIPLHIRNTPDLFELYISSGLFFGIIFEITSSLCLESATPTLRLYGLQTMETWLGRIETENLCVRVGTDDIITGRDGQPVSIGSKILRNMLISRLASISLLLTKTWSHPAKLVNHMVPVVYQRVVDLNHKLDTMMQSRSVVGGPDNPDIWAPFISNALHQPVEHRGRYQALSALLPSVGGQRLLQLHPQVIRSLILSMRVRDVGSSVGSFFGNLLRSLFADALLTPHSIRKMYLTEIAEALCSSEYKLRVNTADYIIPELLVIDAISGPLLIEKLRKVATLKGCSFVQALWGIVSVVLHARLLGKAGGDISDSDTTVLTTPEDANSHSINSSQQPHQWRPLSVHEIEAVCLSEDIDLRLAGLAALTASQKTVHPLPDLELKILRKTLPYSLKSPLSDIRQRVLRVLRILITRLKESYRSCVRDLKKAVVHRYKDASPDDLSLVFENCNQDNGVLLARSILRQPSAYGTPLLPSSASFATAPPESEQKLASVAVTIIETLEWLSSLILANIYPGAPNDREMMALEMLRCILNGITGNISAGFGEKTRNSHVTSSQDDKILESALLSHFYSRQMTQSLLNLLISSWDKTRSLAAEILLLMPRPLPGYETPAAVASLWRWGCNLSGSAKQRESDSGALLLRVINVIYSLDLRWTSLLDNNQSIDVTALPATGTALSSKATETNAFISRLCDILDCRLGELSAVFDAISATSQGRYAAEESAAAATAAALPPLPTMLSHGLVLTLKYCLEDVNSNGLLAPSAGNPDQHKGRTQKKKQSPPFASASDGTPATAAEVDWSATVRRVMNLALSSLQSALQIVAEAPMDNYFAPVPKIDAGKDHLLQQGSGEQQQEEKKANTHGYSSDSFMLNTNVFMDLEESGDGLGDGKEDSIGRRMQFAVVGAWLLVKESCALLAKLVEISPPLLVDPLGEETDPSCTTLLTIAEIGHIGDVILDALARLKHNGAIAEAHAALQSVCESVLKYSGRSNVSLSHLPLSWLQSLINKLNGEQQVFILRRSAGFAFSFLSLLRSEPKNCKPVLLPLAMEVLFSFAAKGCVGGIEDQLSSEPPSVDVMEGVAWRTIVHSLNILRLIILDATLGPDLHPYIAQATKIAVRGFQSPLWAIRNSSMMVFAAIVQRTIDNDKKESGGRRAATPREFFMRYPSLFPFILRELARIVGAVIEFDEKGYPANVMMTISSSQQQLVDTNPSLYPILLMLSKMRTDTLESVPPTAKLPQRKGTCSSSVSGVSGDEEDLETLTIGEENCNIDLFIPLVQLCSSQKLFQVRVMAAKALSSLVPLQKVPEEIATVLQSLIDSFNPFPAANSASSRKRFCSNLLHGSLLQVWDLVSNLHWYMSGDSASMGTNEVLYSSIASNLDTLVIPKLVRLQQAMISAAVSNENSAGSSSSVLSHFPYAPVILLTFKRIVSVVYRVYSNDILSELLIKICEMNVSNLLPAPAALAAGKEAEKMQEEEQDEEDIDIERNATTAVALQAAKIPFAPLLWKESLIDLTKQTFRSELLKLYPTLSPVYGKTLRPEMTQPSSPDHHSLLSMPRLLKLFQHPTSEVREGVLVGALDSFVEITELDLSGQDLPTKSALIGAFLDLAKGHSESFLTLLFRRIITELEPPILQITLQLILNISLWTPFSSLDEDTKEDCLSSFRTLLQVACGTYDPDTLLDFLDQTIDKSTRSKFTELEITKTTAAGEDDSLLTIAPTMAASYALQILGWMVRSFFESSIINWTQAEETRLPFGCLLPESECGPRVSHDRDDDDSVLMCYSWHVWSWLRLVELAGVGEECNTDSRYAAAKSLMSSKALFWSTRSSIDGIRQPIDEKFKRYSGGGAFSCRIWTLALKMLQDDDSDVRHVMNSAVGTAAKLAAVLAPELQSWFTHKLTALPLTETPVYEEAVETMEQLMKPFAHQLSGTAIEKLKKSNTESGHNPSPAQTALSRVQWTQGLIMEQISLPLSLAILWSLIQQKQQCAVSDWVSEVPATSPRLLLQTKAHLFSPSSLLLLDQWINTFQDEGGQQSFPPTNIQKEQSGTEAEASSSSSPVEVPDKIFEADQSNLFEEATIFSSSLTFALSCATTLLPCSQTLSISSLLCHAALQTLTLLQQYLQQQQLKLQGQDGSLGSTDSTALWLGGLTYHPVLYGKLYNSLVGAAHLCHLYRKDRPSLSSTLLSESTLGSPSAEEQEACVALFPLLLAVVTRAKQLMVQLRNQHGAATSLPPPADKEDSQRVICLVHPSIVALLVEICGEPSQSPESSSPLC